MSAEEEITQEVGEPVQNPASPSTTFIEPKGGPKAILGRCWAQFEQDVATCADECGVPLRYGRDYISIMLMHRHPIERQIFDDLTIVVMTDYHHNWSKLIKTLRNKNSESQDPRVRNIQVEIITPLAAADYRFSPLSNARLIQDWEKIILPRILKIPIEMQEESRNASRPFHPQDISMRWNTIDCLDMQLQMFDGSLSESKSTIILITVPVGRWNQHWSRAVEHIRSLLVRQQQQDRHGEYDAVKVVVQQGDFGRSADRDEGGLIRELDSEKIYGKLHMGQMIGPASAQTHAASGTLGPIFEVWNETGEQFVCLGALTSYHAVNDKVIITAPPLKAFQNTLDYLKVYTDRARAGKDTEEEAQGVASRKWQEKLWRDSGNGLVGKVLAGSGTHPDLQYTTSTGAKKGRIDWALIDLTDGNARLPPRHEINQFPSWSKSGPRNRNMNSTAADFLPAWTDSWLPNYLNGIASRRDLEDGDFPAFKVGAQTGYTRAYRNSVVSGVKVDTDPDSCMGTMEQGWISDKDYELRGFSDTGAYVWDRNGYWIGMAFAGDTKESQVMLYMQPAEWILWDIQQRFKMRLRFPQMAPGTFLEPKRPE